MAMRSQLLGLARGCCALSQQELASRAHMNLRTVINYEHG